VLRRVSAIALSSLAVSTLWELCGEECGGAYGEECGDAYGEACGGAYGEACGEVFAGAAAAAMAAGADIADADSAATARAAAAILRKLQLMLANVGRRAPGGGRTRADRVKPGSG
jgi:hypothetical protein